MSRLFHAQGVLWVARPAGHFGMGFPDSVKRQQKKVAIACGWCGLGRRQETTKLTETGEQTTGAWYVCSEHLRPFSHMLLVPTMCSHTGVRLSIRQII